VNHPYKQKTKTKQNNTKPNLLATFLQNTKYDEKAALAEKI
jgi:hypothetical protein